MITRAHERKEVTNPADLCNPDVRRVYSSPAIKAFIRMMEEWDMSVAERCAILGGVPRPTYFKWAKGNVGNLSRDLLDRIGVLLGIYKGLELLFPDEGGRLRWFKSPNIDYAFQGRAPADRLTDGGMQDLYDVRAYIDALRGGA